MATKTEGVEFSCSFCGQPASQTKLIAGPAIMICADCVARSMEIAREGEGGVQSTPDLIEARKQLDAYRLLPCLKFAAKLRREPMCNFCGNLGPGVVQPPSTLGTHAFICSQCLDLCQDIIREQLR